MGKTTKCETTSTHCSIQAPNKNDLHSCHKLSRHVRFRGLTTNTHAFKREDIKQLIAITINTMVRPIAYRIDYHAVFLNQPKLFVLYLQSNVHTAAIVQALNTNRQNLLHLACEENRSEFVALLLRKGCDPAKQDYDGQTPFHTALMHGHIECITEFLNVMEEGPRYDNNPNVKRMQEGLKNMFRLYSHTGYTIIHMTVLKNLPEILADLLKFCLKHGIDVLQSEVLGCGDTLLHLAMKMHAVDVARVIVEYIPESVRARNYAGALAYDVDAISDEMRGLLNARRKR